ncbi:hypothetical protein TSAR_012644 [Trichomalopsis sarcophagae]|uniref:Large ribosomal subunit protein bL28m n=1 Tax=Trichomalopsis sarcophagae TaxID=543379 RepID=A0A232FJX3_9HYME|nr:hypothetical protein TSAR_012644 [Trichomalopsis sarcophagae]
MAQSSHAWKKKLYYLPKVTRWSNGIGAALPEEYKKFWIEWKVLKPAPVHYIPKPGRWEKKPSGDILPVQNIPLPLKYPKEIDQGIWGGEAVVQGFTKKFKRRRIPHFWVPQLLKSVVYSEILDKYIKTIVTFRALQLIHDNYGFDHYLLKTKACDLRSLLALKLKREMLIQLWDKTLYPNDPIKQEEVYAKYQHYLPNYTRKEIEWYGLTWREACNKLIQIQTAAYKAEPLKIKFREQFIKELEEEKLEEQEGNDNNVKSKRSWVSKLNPFGSDKSTTV